MTRRQTLLYGIAFAAVLAASAAGESLLNSGVTGIIAIAAVLVAAVALVYAAERRWFE